uniref:MULE transposase domain-containing protein n=1 Tax=Plectus sambesii TaxID=2011161 RepID=A0A914WPA9_9BILA
MEEVLRLIKSSRSGAENTHSGMLGELHGFTFHLDKPSKNGKRLYGICMEKYSSKCKARLTTDLAFMVVKSDLNLHPNHFGSTAKVEALKAQESMKRHVVETMEATSAVIDQMRQVSSIATIAHLPSSSSASRAETFLRYDSKDYRGYREGSRCLFFASERSLELLNSTADIYADGTFEVTPGLFLQFYRIHVRYQGGKHTIPCIYAFMPNRQKQTYIKMLQHLKQLCPNMAPRSIMTDFEQAALGAFQHVWPRAEIKGCFFHLSQNQCKALVREGLQELVAENEDLELQVRMLRAMAFVPIHDLDTVWEELVSVLDERLTPLIEYFDKFYMGQVLAGP